MTTMSIRDARLFVEVVGRGYPLALMHGGPGADHWTMLPFRQLSDRFTLVFYDHRCNGRSVGAPVTSMTWENLTADADALRQSLGFDKWAVLGHSFGGKVALEYALRYPGSLSHLVLLDAGGDSYWDQENAPELLAKRGFSRRKVELAQRWFNGRIAPWEFYPTLMRLGGAYDPHTSWLSAMRLMFAERRSKARPQAEIFGFGQLMKGWTVMDRLGEIRVPTLVMAGRDDFVFPPEHQGQLAAGIPNARLEIIERAGHNPHDERTAEVMRAIRDFIPTDLHVQVDHGCAVVNTTLERQKGRSAPANPKVSLLVVDPENTSRYIQIRGDAELTTDGALDHIDTITRKYTRLRILWVRLPGHAAVA